MATSLFRLTQDPTQFIPQRRRATPARRSPALPRRRPASSGRAQPSAGYAVRTADTGGSRRVICGLQSRRHDPVAQTCITMPRRALVLVIGSVQ